MFLSKKSSIKRDRAEVAKVLGVLPEDINILNASSKKNYRIEFAFSQLQNAVNQPGGLSVQSQFSIEETTLQVGAIISAISLIKYNDYILKVQRQVSKKQDIILQICKTEIQLEWIPKSMNKDDIEDYFKSINFQKDHNLVFVCDDEIIFTTKKAFRYIVKDILGIDGCSIKFKEK